MCSALKTLLRLLGAGFVRCKKSLPTWSVSRLGEAFSSPLLAGSGVPVRPAQLRAGTGFWSTSVGLDLELGSV